MNVNTNTHTNTNTQNRLLTCIAAAVALIVMPAHGQSEIHVPDDHPSIQEAIDAATHGDEIIVLPGTYNEAIDFDGKAVHLRSSDGPEVTIIDASGLDTSVVTCASGEGPDTILEGFTITGGIGTLVNNLRRGGGMYNVGSSPTVTDCRFVGNTADRGGGMRNSSSNPTVTNCDFVGNTADRGGGMHNVGSSPLVKSCHFKNNSASSRGGGMGNLNNSSPTVEQCTFKENSADGMFNGFFSSPTVTDSVFENNTNTGMYNWRDSSPEVTNCIFKGNIGGSSGGGMSNVQDCNPLVTDCVFIDNSADLRGGGMNNNIRSSPEVTNCIFEGNSAGEHGGGMRNGTESNPTVVACIFKNNTAEEGGGMGNWNNSSPVVIDTTFVGNTAVRGGGMHTHFQEGTPTVLNCIFEGNTASNEGGGIWGDEDSPSTLQDTVVCDNLPDDIAGPWNDFGGNTICDLGDPPVAVCEAYPSGDPDAATGGELHVECDGPDGAEVTLDGSGSFDPQNSTLTFQWDVSEFDVTLDNPQSPVATGVFPIGVTTATLTVENEFGLFATCDITVHVQDTEPPEVLITTDKAALWPPNHTMREVEVIITATDVCEDPEYIFPIYAVASSNEPDNAEGNGDGDTIGDVHGKDGYASPVDITDEFDWDPDYGEDGAWIGTIQLRAERAGSGSGRAYTIEVEAFDSQMNVGRSTIVVVVPRSQGQGGGGGNN